MYKRLEQLQAGGRTFIKAVYAGIFLITLLLILFWEKGMDYFLKRTELDSYSNVLMLLGGLLIWGGCLFVAWCVLRKSDAAHFTRALGVVSALVFVCQLFLIYQIYFKTGWDTSVVMTYASELSQRPLFGEVPYLEASYYQQYPNNIALTVIFSVLFRIARLCSFDAYFFVCAVGAACVNLSMFLLAKTIRKITVSDPPQGGYVAALLLYGLSPWIAVPYSDTFAAPFPMLMLYLYAGVFTARKTQEKTTWWRFVLIFVCAVCGYFIKPQCIIVLAAICINEIVHVTLPLLHRKSVLRAGALLLFVALLIPAIRTAAYKVSGFIPNENSEFTLTHFAMMGLNDTSDGCYLAADVNISVNCLTKEERVQTNLHVIRERLQTYGFSGLMQHLSKKLLMNLCDGTFAWAREGNFFIEVSSRDGRIASFLRSIFYPDGQRFQYFVLFEQMLWFGTLFLCLVSVIKPRKDEASFLLCAQTVLIGIILFTLIFEGRARYLYAFAPVFVLCAAIGLQRCVDTGKVLFPRCIAFVRTKAKGDSQNTTSLCAKSL